jgi:hypothetical protein
MSTENRPERPDLAEDTVLVDELEEFEFTSPSRRRPYKSVLAAVVIGIVAIGATWLILDQSELHSNETTTKQTKAPVLPATVVKDFETTSDDEPYRRIERRLDALTDRIEHGFESQASQGSELKHRLSVMGDSLRAIETSIAKLNENNRMLAQHIHEATTKLDALAKHVRALEVRKRKAAAKSKPRPAKVPPFRVDAIDVWDDTTYVAISQAGRVAFLKQGDRRAGWSVTRIDRRESRVAFRGPAGQIHSVTLQR